jgi:hypothetical protein
MAPARINESNYRLAQFPFGKIVIPRFVLCLAVGLAGFILPVNAQEGSAISAYSTNVLQWRTMHYADFLPGHPDETKQRQLCVHEGFGDRQTGFHARL